MTGSAEKLPSTSHSDAVEAPHERVDALVVWQQHLERALATICSVWRSSISRR